MKADCTRFVLAGGLGRRMAGKGMGKHTWFSLRSGAGGPRATASSNGRRLGTSTPWATNRAEPIEDPLRKKLGFALSNAPPARGIWGAVSAPSRSRNPSSPGRTTHRRTRVRAGSGGSGRHATRTHFAGSTLAATWRGSMVLEHPLAAQVSEQRARHDLAEGPRLAPHCRWRSHGDLRSKTNRSR